MNTIEIPFNKFVGIKKTDNEDQFLLELPASENLERKKRVIIPVDIKIMDKDNKITMTAKIDWFIQKI